MRRAWRALAGIVTAAALVAGVLAVGLLAAGLVTGELTARRVFGGMLGAGVAPAIVRLAPAQRVLGGYAALVYAGLFVPIAVVVLYAFNGGRTSPSGRASPLIGSPTRSANRRSRTQSSACWRLGCAARCCRRFSAPGAALAMIRLCAGFRTPVKAVVLPAIVLPEVVWAIAMLTFFTNTAFVLGSVAMLAGHTVFNLSFVILIVRARCVAMGDASSWRRAI